MLTAPEQNIREIPIEEEEDRSWWGDAHCNSGGAGLAALFFSEELQDIAAAKRICADCPVLVVAPPAT